MLSDPRFEKETLQAMIAPGLARLAEIEAQEKAVTDSRYRALEQEAKTRDFYEDMVNRQWDIRLPYIILWFTGTLSVAVMSVLALTLGLSFDARWGMATFLIGGLGVAVSLFTALAWLMPRIDRRVRDAIESTMS